MKILNVWTSKKGNLNYYEEDNQVYQNGDWRIFKQFGSYLYTYKNIAVNCLCGLKKDHIDRLAKGERPTGEYSPDHFLFDRANTVLKKGLKLLK